MGSDRAEGRKMMQMSYKWHSCSCYVQGITHIRLGLPCQDCAKTTTKNEVKIIALSDGCGSSEVSQIGSKLTVDFIVDFLSENFNKLFCAAIEAVSIPSTI